MLTRDFGGFVQIIDISNNLGMVLRKARMDKELSVPTMKFGREKITGDNIFSAIREYGSSVEEVVAELINGQKITDYYIENESDLAIEFKLPAELVAPVRSGFYIKSKLVILEEKTSKKYPIKLFMKVHNAHRTAKVLIDYIL